MLERDVAPDVAPPTATAAGIVREEAALAVADGDGAAFLEDVRQVPVDDEVAVAPVEDDPVEAALFLAGVEADDLGPGELLAGVPPDGGPGEGVGDLVVVVDGDLELLAVLAELGPELARAACAGVR